MGGDQVLRSEPDRAAAGTVRILTLNLGLLCLELRGGWRIALAAHFEQRLAPAPQLLSSVDADILALQEVYSSADRHFLAQTMAARYPFSAEPPRARSLIGNGLMLLSRFPILSSSFIPCRGAPWWTRLLWQQGYLAVEIDLPFVGRTRLINVHLAASVPFGDSRTVASKANRKREIGQLLSAASASSRAAILAGDFNTSEEIYPENYHRIIDAGYADAFILANTSARNFGAFTWDSANPLNARGRFRDSPSQRIDHVFVLKAQSLVPVAAQVVLKDQSIRTKSGRHMPLSDHYGMLVTLAL
jgi:endonuclease/exonuclease/phosphatase family metal-dependent hydrolase